MQQHGRGSLLPSFILNTIETAIPPTSSCQEATSKPQLPLDPFTAGMPGSQMSLQDATPPLADPSSEEAEALLSGALYGFTTEDRDQALADVHGVTSAVAMDNEFIAGRLAHLDQALSDTRSKSAYLRAKIQDPEYVSNREFRLQFLMADNFDPQAAAERLVAFFESKLVLFGPEKLTRDLTLEDLSGDDIKSLEHGVVQRLVGKDHAGRVVVSCWPTTVQESSIHIQNKLKAFWYLVSSIVSEESQESQRNGFVLVIFGMGPRAQADRYSLWKLMYILRSLPARVASVHFCYDDPEAKAIANLAVVALDRKSRARFRTHYGSHDDVVAELSTFGVGSNLLTFDPSSEESTMVIREWFANRRLKEANERAAAATKKEAPSGGVVSEIGHYDVLFGRGKGIQAHPGNKRLRELVEANLGRYEQASRLEKTLLAETIVRNIKDTSGRFLKLDSGRGGGWTEVNDEIARDKIAHAFRTQRKSQSQRQSPAAIKMAPGERKPPPPGTSGNPATL
ncbi:hypothetical protein IV203_010621 [Nitzschia inconspicua]|uniref:DUF6824 domain-containing protein n=1 Tax=Nitzschia inconspicua TaxID=303405 RepID=A0A9K3KX76_9STRA|nr:hypothetical protein IV203_010621 [Nitzschia inconspicua]